MCHHFTHKDVSVEDDGKGSSGSRGFIGTIIAIEVMDLSLSVDNVVAAVAMSPKLWVVCTGVFIGILALRFVAGACLKLIERYPILEETAFLLIGYVGFILVFELLTDPLSGLQVLPGPVHVSAGEKFIGIALILALSILYSKFPTLQTALKPVFKGLTFPMKAVAVSVGLILKTLLRPFSLLLRLFRSTRPQQD